MKRELKGDDIRQGRNLVRGDRKAHPDEKGTESRMPTWIIWSGLRYRKAHPDEKGTERASSAAGA